MRMVAETPLMDFLRMGLHYRIFCVCLLNFRYIHAELELQTCQCGHQRTIVIETRSISAYGCRHSITGFSGHVTPMPDFQRM